jgi:hypothetical protein
MELGAKGERAIELMRRALEETEGPARRTMEGPSTAT